VLCASRMAAQCQQAIGNNRMNGSYPEIDSKRVQVAHKRVAQEFGLTCWVHKSGRENGSSLQGLRNGSDMPNDLWRPSSWKASRSSGQGYKPSGLCSL